MPTDITTQIKTSFASLDTEFQAVAHNIANANTAGYKRIVTSFAKELAAQQGVTFGQDTSQAELDLSIDFSQGASLTQTGRKLDMALYGKGFFVIETENGQAYTRNGMFELNQNGQIVDSAGNVVSGENGPITVTGGDASISQITVSNDGTVSIGARKLGKFKIVDFPENEAKVLPSGNGYFRVPDDIKATAVDKIVVKQGYLESSNVKIVDELVKMIMVSRLYEANVKLLSAKKDGSRSLMNLAMG